MRQRNHGFQLSQIISPERKSRVWAKSMQNPPESRKGRNIVAQRFNAGNLFRHDIKPRRGDTDSTACAASPWP